MLLQARRVAEESLLVKSIMHVASRKQTHGHGLASQSTHRAVQPYRSSSELPLPVNHTQQQGEDDTENPSV
jgi:hypothetical protein